jgi:hypothetical protein
MHAMMLTATGVPGYPNPDPTLSMNGYLVLWLRRRITALSCREVGQVTSCLNRSMSALGNQVSVSNVTVPAWHAFSPSSVEMQPG